MSDSKKKSICFADVLKNLEELRRTCIYSPSGRVKKNPNLREANRALATEVNVLKAMDKRNKDSSPGEKTDRITKEQKKKFIEKIRKLKETRKLSYTNDLEIIPQAKQAK